MASTYVNDLRLNEMATGDASGSWGTITNTNLELIGEAFGYGTETIGNADTTITMADGASDAARSFYLKITSSADLTTTRVITLAPNTVSKVWIIENATSGSQIITIKQGTGATINIPNGHVKMIATDGAGSGGAVLDLLTDLNVATNLFVKNAGTGDGSTANIYLQTAEADIAADDVIGKINFQAPNEGTGTDAILVSAAIQAISEGDFSSSSNATSLNFMTGASEAATTKMTLSSGGNLTVTGDVTATGALSAKGGAVFNEDSADVDFRVESNGSAYALFVDGGNNHVNILTSTDLGAVLNVSGNAYIQHADNSDTLTLESTDDDANNGPNLRLFRNSANPAADDQTGRIDFDGEDSSGGQTTFARILTQIKDPTNTSEAGRFAINTVVAGSMQSRINVMPTETVFNDESIDLDFRVESNDNAHMIFVDGGSNEVGIGTSDPRSPLHVQTSHTSTDVTAANTNSTLSVGNSGSGNGVYNSIKFSGNQQDMYIMSVNHATQASRRIGFFVGSVAGDAVADERFSISGDGSLSTPTLGTSNVRFGVNAGNSIASGGNYNTLIGDEAGTALTTGDNNVAIGFQALDAEDDHGANVAIGRSALSVLNAGADGYNVAIGYVAGDAMSTGTKNIAVGAFAMDATVTGSENVAIGYQAATDLTSGIGNVIIGQEAGNNITTAADNVVIGKAALQAVAGGGNIAIGAKALRVNTSSNNLAIGHSALKANTSGLYNVAIGHEAMLTNIDGDGAVAVGYEALKAQEPSNGLTYNVAIGYEAGNDVSTGTGNTFVGGLAGDKVTSGDANVAIGQEAGGSGAASTGSHNTSVGLQAGSALTTGTQNVLMGNYTGDSFTIGRYNVAIGYNTLGADVLGDRTTAVGYQSAFYQVAGSNNAEMSNSYHGMYAGHYNVTGTKNTSMGYQAGMGHHTSSASNNVAIGCNAGLVMRGDNNTLVGALAGDAITTGDTNSAFGKEALTACNTGTNNTAIGNNALAGVNTGVNNIGVGDTAGNNITSGDANVCIGINCNPSAADGDEQIIIASTNTSGAGNQTVRFGSALGTVYIGLNNSTTSWTKSSDERLKENIETSTAGLSFINDLRPVTFDWKKKRDIPEDMKFNYSQVADDAPCVGNGKKVHGFIAQEVEAVIANHPEVVEGNSITDIDAQGVHSLADGAMMPMMVKAVQELSTKLDAALARIEELEG